MSEAKAAGGTQPKAKSKYDYTNGPPPLEINLKWCKACNICIALCPTQVFEPDRDGRPTLARPDNCTQCTVCWIHCPDLAITSNYK
jgi:NAD-dependent dihydropyrimidine dehydrogenase PreA subunit